jgi:hypothetical protein
MWVHWWDIRNNVLIDGGKGQPGKLVAVRSEHHRAPPGGYAVLERIPKWIRGSTRFKTRDETSLSLLPGQVGSSYFWSEPWRLAAPRDERSVAEYQAFPNRGRSHDPNVVSYSIRCSELFIERERRAREFHGRLDPATAHPPSLKIGSIGGGVQRGTIYRGSAPIDPPVEVELVQGVSLARHLIDVARGFQAAETAGPFEFSPESVTYFAGRPFDVPDDPVRAEIGPAMPLRVNVNIGDSDALRCAFAVAMRNRETGVRAISDPTFLTSVMGSVIATDVPADMLSSESASVLLALADADGDLAVAAEALRTPEATMWSRIELATEELGTDCVDDAVAFIAYSTGAQTRAPMPM